MRKIGYFDIYVDEMDRAQQFYEQVLDTTLSKMDDPNDDSVQMRVFEDDYRSHGAGGALVKVKGAKPGPGGTMVYFTCEDCAIEEGRVVRAGGKVVRTKYAIGEHGFVSIARDTEGNMIGFHSMK
ncbi:MAG: VOC family protein [Candidatus Margulisbacteria bacterium]|nr:VOC family protein [Candidatus Margulisiibacteriota bacterium]